MLCGFGLLGACDRNLMMKEDPANTTVPLGILDEDVSIGDHVAYFWETDREFERGCEFLAAGLRVQDHCVIFGVDAANRRVCDVLKRRGLNLRDLRRQRRLSVLKAGTTADATLNDLDRTLSDALQRGAPLIRVLGNVGNIPWPMNEGLLLFEAKVTAVAKSFVSVIVCMYDAQTLPGSISLHSALVTHPVLIRGNIMRQNPRHVQVEDLVWRLRGVHGKGARESTRSAPISKREWLERSTQSQK